MGRKERKKERRREIKDKNWKEIKNRVGKKERRRETKEKMKEIKDWGRKERMKKRDEGQKMERN